MESKGNLLSRVRLFETPCNFPGQNTGVCSLSLLQGVFPTQGLNPGLLHCRWILYQLSHRGSPTWNLTSEQNHLGQKNYRHIILLFNMFFIFKKSHECVSPRLVSPGLKHISHSIHFMLCTKYRLN